MSAQRESQLEPQVVPLLEPQGPELEPLHAKIGEAHHKIGGLESRLRAIDDELAGFGQQREQYRLLDDVCNTLETLAQQGIAQTFWGDRADQADGHLREVRERV